jgi:hypothetical protein
MRGRDSAKLLKIPTPSTQGRGHPYSTNLELNLVVDEIPRRDPVFWIDEPPPEKDHELGIGRLAA